MNARRAWLPWEEEFMRAHYADSLTAHLAEVLGVTVHRVVRKARAMGLKKSREFKSVTARERSSRPDHGGRAFLFPQGLVPWNKGLRGVGGDHPACRASQFKKGNRPHTWVPVGSFRITPDGVLERKFSDEPGPPTNRWRNYAALVWEAAYGPVPAGHIVVFRPSLRTTDPALVTLDRLECISRAENVRRNSIHQLPPELADVCRLRGSLTRAINTRAKEAPAP